MLSHVMAWTSLIQNFQVSCLFFSELRKREFVVWRLRYVGNRKMHVQITVFYSSLPWEFTSVIGGVFNGLLKLLSFFPTPRHLAHASMAWSHGSMDRLGCLCEEQLSCYIQLHFKC